MFTWDKGAINDEQENAVVHLESVLLIACPGSGKTRTLTYKIAYELSRLKSEKAIVIAITYTNIAAEEIKERVENLGVNIKQLWIGTIHSFCLEWILRPYSLYIEELKDGFRILNSHESEELLTKLCDPYKNQRITYFNCGYIAELNGYKITSLETRKHPIIQLVIDKYFKILKENRQIDFEQILYYSYKLLKDRPVISAILSKIFPFILIDEYQDTKLIQYHIISFILNAGKGNTKTLIVGDPNQSIYNTLGGFPMGKSDLEGLTGFPLVELSLSKNYRSSKKIVSYFDYYKTFPNTITAVGLDADYPSKISFNNIVNRADVVDEIVRLILYNVKNLGISPNEICIVAPQWIHLASLTRALMVKLPDYSFDGPGMAPFSRDIDNFWYRVSRIILTEPSPNIYVRRLRWSLEILDELNHAGINTSSFTSKSFLKLCNSISIDEKDGLEYLKLFFNTICSKLSINIEKVASLNEHYISFFNSSESRIERLKKEGNKFIGDIESFKKVFKQSEGITVSTIHGVKGSEYDTLIAFALLENYVPHYSDGNGQQNAKKMLYVISSRARKNLHLISECGRTNIRGEDLVPTIQLGTYQYAYDKLIPN